MASILFFEKPACINGEKQKSILRAAGHDLICINILTHPWSVETLLPFVANKTVRSIMNLTAPAIKNGEIDPGKLSFERPVELMIIDPILIRRPLIVVDNQYIQGFDDKRLIPFLGNWQGEEDVTTCPNLHTVPCL